MDDETIALAPRGKPLAQLYREHRLALVRVGLLLLGDQAAAEDAVQDVFAALHRRGVDASQAYLRAAVVNQCRSVVRRTILGRRNVAPIGPAEPPPGERLELAEEHREVIHQGTVKSTAARGLDRLRALLGEEA